MKKVKLLCYGALFSTAVLFSCSKSKSDDTGTPTTPTTPGATSKFIVSGTAAVAEQDKTYLFTTDQLTSGTISVKGNGRETNGSTLHILNNKAFCFKYNRGNDGFTEVYQLNNNGKLDQVSSFSVKSVNVFLPFKNNQYLLAYNIGRSLTTTGTAYWINTSTNKVEKDRAFSQIMIDYKGKRLANYYAFIYGFFEYGNFIYAVYAPTYGGTGDKDPQDYRNVAFVSVFDKDMNFVKTISDDRMPYIGRYYTGTGLGQTENGDIYAFSNGETTTANNHSAFLKITNNEFDKSYYYDVEAAAKGMRIHYGKYVGNNKFLLLMVSRDEAKAESEGAKVAIVNVVDKSFTWVSGISAKIAYEAYDFPLFSHGGKGYIALPESSTKSVIYEIDPATNSAKRGLELDGIKAVTGLGNLSDRL
ncbi:DUF4374 domain-containing protein [Chitinophaga nivalis]|uniref:DUF4374 domain-containing protein n=1 Tax=Chitinophaga nivalis TaxID=2991709 RepID=A0ABT3IRV5_9BACT|nr:DUF4374 domain-containing protein [Chitinophaga nivalis]MCW3463689.1 DUF4374 domain-containing protein [Chitinophaga nivalis]MCW3486621.1 DUF4374 domain-containing protein [Chitinophaga nivalis]